MDIESQMIEFMRPLFGDMAEKAMENQKRKLGLEEGRQSLEDYQKIAEAIRDLCRHMAGDAIAIRIYSGLIELLETTELER